MKTAIIGSRGLDIEDIGKYLPEGITEIVSGGAKGVDRTAKEYAAAQGILYREFLPDYARYGRYAPLQRNLEIIEYADRVIAFWDGKSRGTSFVIDRCRKCGKDVLVIEIPPTDVDGTEKG